MGFTEYFASSGRASVTLGQIVVDVNKLPPIQAFDRGLEGGLQIRLPMLLLEPTRRGAAVILKPSIAVRTVRLIPKVGSPGPP